MPRTCKNDKVPEGKNQRCVLPCPKGISRNQSTRRCAPISRAVYDKMVKERDRFRMLSFRLLARLALAKSRTRRAEPRRTTSTTATPLHGNDRMSDVHAKRAAELDGHLQRLLKKYPPRYKGFSEADVQKALQQADRDLQAITPRAGPSSSGTKKRIKPTFVRSLI